jgi:hypothetical protein
MYSIYFSQKIFVEIMMPFGTSIKRHIERIKERIGCPTIHEKVNLSF